MLHKTAVRGKGSTKCSGIEPFVLPFLSAPPCTPLRPPGQRARSPLAQKEVVGCDVCLTLEMLLETTPTSVEEAAKDVLVLLSLLVKQMPL